MENNRWIAASTIVLFFLLGCKEKSENEKIDFKLFDVNEKPMICVLDNDSISNKYVVEFWFCPTNEILLSDAEMYKRNGSFFFSFTEPKTNEFLLFNFGRQVKESNEIVIDFQGNQLGLGKVTKNCVLEKKFGTGDDSVFVFRLLESYCYEGEYLDVVYFVSQKRGVLGSYISHFVKDIEYYTWSRGEVFENVIDFSRMKEMSLQ